MSNFDYKKYLAEGKLLKEDINYDEFDDELDFKSLLELGAKATKLMGEDKLMKISDAFEERGDEQSDAIASHLNMAIELIQDGESISATPHLKKFNKACREALGELGESVNEGKLSHIKEDSFSSGEDPNIDLYSNSFGGPGTDKRSGQVIGDIIQLIRSTGIDVEDVMEEIATEFDIPFEFGRASGMAKKADDMHDDPGDIRIDHDSYS